MAHVENWRPPVPDDLVAMIDKARRDWLAARNEFDAVTDPDLIDHAIYAMHAAERRYVYLMRMAARLRGGRRGEPDGPDPASTESPPQP
ncbi:YaaL family protein [Carboxydochorda subterranea]|uniref:YaaL family protein n=1 Tax=Carboxydichorda subterranea TaxID=3109565 RepID=A0ABZ1BY50_9FIRM|nr:YaaL family protein [Limnochorda sp. L945t]WRP17624.1 YaaL family protein [Limnochorda sp. L945t]